MERCAVHQYLHFRLDHKLFYGIEVFFSFGRETGEASGDVSLAEIAIESSVLYSAGQPSRVDNLHTRMYTVSSMTPIEVERQKNPGSGFAYTFTGRGLRAHADFDPVTGEAKVNFEQATNMAAALEAVVDYIQNEAAVWATNTLFPLRIDIHAGKFDRKLANVARRFGLKGPIPADESGSEGILYRIEPQIHG
jgi:hypothetical protein